MIKAIAFDFGGVIEIFGKRNILNDIAHIIGVPEDDFRRRYFELNHLSNVGNISWEALISQVIESFTHSAELKMQSLDEVKRFQSEAEINQGLIAMLPALRRQGYTIALLSNATSQLRDKLKRLGIEALFDEVVVSGEIGFQKPHREAFEVLFSRLGVMPQEVVFVDDTSRSLEKAHEIGYTPILFRGNEQLFHDLKALGIEV
jgi:putative hydrolase of the HAD superfamily